MKLNIQLLRHGKTPATENSLYCGKTDLPLSENGVEELKELKQQNIYRGDCVFYTSDMIRAKQTKEILFGKGDSTVVAELNEMNFGDFEMKAYEELLKDERYIKWIEDESGNMPCPNGESALGFTERAKSGYNKIYADMVKNNVNKATIVCHGGTIAYYLNFYLKSDNIFELMPKPGRGYILNVDFDGETAEMTDYFKI